MVLTGSMATFTAGLGLLVVFRCDRLLEVGILEVASYDGWMAGFTDITSDVTLNWCRNGLGRRRQCPAAKEEDESGPETHVQNDISHRPNDRYAALRVS